MSDNKQNLDFSAGGYVCHHLRDSDDYDFAHHYTGIGVAHNITCLDCAKNIDTITLYKVTQDYFNELDEYCEEIYGEPEILERATDLQFTHEIATLKTPLKHAILSIKPMIGTEQAHWIALLTSREVVQIDLTNASMKQLMLIPDDALIFSDQVVLHISPNQQFIAIANERGDEGVVINLSTQKISMTLNRGSYHSEETPFPIAFFESDNRTHIVHGTAWNKLDISDAKTGETLTEREHETVTKDKPDPEHYLDYFHSLPAISPTAEWIAEDGWVWQPAGVTRIWNLQNWLHKNVWESEDGETAKRLQVRFRFYEWNVPLCWIDHDTLALWSFGDQDYALVDAIQLFDAKTGKRIRWFAGVQKGALYFDGYLFSTSDKGTDVWDVNTGERLLQDHTLKPINYHPTTQQFLTILPNQTFQLSRLTP